MAEKKLATKVTQKSAKSATARNKTSKGFTADERAAMKARAQELKALARASKTGADGERDLLAAIAAMREPDRPMAKRPHAIIEASAPELGPKTCYAMPADGKDGEVVCFFKTAEKCGSRSATFGFEEAANLD